MRPFWLTFVGIVCMVVACNPALPPAFLPVASATPGQALDPGATATPTAMESAATPPTNLTVGTAVPAISAPIVVTPPIDPTATEGVATTPSPIPGAPPPTITPHNFFAPPLINAFELYPAGIDPTGEWGAVWQFTEEEYATLERIPAGTLIFYNLATGEVCDGSEFADYYTYNSSFAWNQDGSYFLIINATLYQGRPCQQQDELEVVAAITHPWPSSLTALGATESDTYRLLVSVDGESRTWHLYNPTTNTLTDIDYMIPFSSAVALSPDGRHLAVTTQTNRKTYEVTTTLIDVATGASVAATTYRYGVAVGDVRTPKWLSNDRVLLDGAAHAQGPLIFTLDGQVEAIATTLFAGYVQLNRCGPNCDHFMSVGGARLPASDSYIIALSEAGGSGGPPPVYVYDSAKQSVTVTDDWRQPIYSPDGRYAVYAEYGQPGDEYPTTLWLRTLNSRVADRILLRTVPTNGPVSVDWSPTNTHIAVREALGGWHVVSLESGGLTMAAYFDGIGGVEWLQWSPDGYYVALGNVSMAGSGLYVVAVE